MKCLKCNKQNEKGAKYCEHCGSKLKKQPNKIFEHLKKYKIQYILVIIVLFLIFLTYQVFNCVTSPAFIANKYIHAIIKNDTEAIYETFNVEENEFTNLEVLNKKIIKQNITNLKLVNKVIVNDQAIITYEYYEDEVLYTATVLLTKNDKKYLLFDNWEVNSGKLVKNITFKVPIDAKITIDDIEIDKYFTGTVNEHNVYTIDNMVKGKYVVKIVLPDETEIEEIVQVENNSIFRVANVELKEETNERLTLDVKNMIETLYNGLIQNVDTDELEYSDEVKDYYRDLKYNYKRVNFTIDSFSIAHIELRNTNYKAGKLVGEFMVEYDYSLSYGNADSTKQYSGSNRSIVKIEFGYGVEYKIESIGKMNLSFPIRK